MPGRISVRAGQPSSSRTKSRPTDSKDEVPDDGPLSSLRQKICAIFGDLQRSNTGHRKLIISLRKIQEWCCYEPVTGRTSQSDQDYDENDFNAEYCRCILRVLSVRKSEPAADRIVKFTGAFLRHATELDNAIFQEGDPEGAQGFPETPTSRLTTQIISLILPLLQAKDKVIRFRCTQIISHLINTLDSVDDELFDHIRLGLLKRLRDKESSVRVQAVCGLGRLAGEGDGPQDPEDSDDDTSGGVLERLLDVLQNDPSGEVRRSLLLNLPFTPATLPFLLERARDLEGSIRRALYARLLPALGDFRHLSLTHREKLLRWGLRDRDEHVRKATGRLFSERWIEDCARPRDEDGNQEEAKPGQLSAPSSEGLMELLERIDVVNAGNDGGIAVDAMRDFWEARPDYADFVVFDESYWKSLTPESVFVARTFNTHCRQKGVSDSLQDKLPEVTRIAFLLQSNINTLAALTQRIATQQDAEEDSVHQEFIVEQLLQIALTLDYSDEVGRRTMFSLMREALALPELPEESTRLVVEVLKMSCGTSASSDRDRDFCGVVLEAIAEVHDTIMGELEPPKEDDVDDSFHSARSEMSGDSTPKQSKNEEVDEEKAIREIMVNMKCLHIAQCMLQNVDCRLEETSHLVTMLNNLVVPAVRSQEAPIRERGLLCLGLCCLLDKSLAEENLTLFLHCFTKGHEQLQMIAIQIIGDILAAHPSLVSKPIPSAEQTEGNVEPEHPLHKPIHKLFSKSIKSPAALVQSTACAALCKLMLSAPSAEHLTAENAGSILDMDELLRLLVLAYFDPETSTNASLRQSLSYFIPVYCHSRKENMHRMGNIVLSVLSWYSSLKDEMDVEGEDEADSEMVSVNVVIAHLADWTDGRKLALAQSGALEADSDIEADTDVHLGLAESVLEKMLGVSSREERKLYITLLGKLFLSSPSSSTPLTQSPNPNSGLISQLQSITTLITEAIDDKIAPDATTRNTLLKFQTMVERCLSTVTTDRSTSNLSRSAEASRVQSPAPSVADTDADAEAADVTQDLSTLNIQSSTTTPAASPRKKRQARSDLSSAEVPLDLASSQLRSSTTTTTPAASPRKTSFTNRQGGATPGRSQRQTMTDSAPLDILQANTTDEARQAETITPSPSKRASRPARHQNTASVINYKEDPELEDSEIGTVQRPPIASQAQVQAPAPESTGSPTKKPTRGRPKRTTTAAVPEPEPEPAIKLEEDAENEDGARTVTSAALAKDVQTEEQEEVPVKRTRGRPSRAAGGGVGAGAPRKSVRAGRPVRGAGSGDGNGAAGEGMGES